MSCCVALIAFLLVLQFAKFVSLFALFALLRRINEVLIGSCALVQVLKNGLYSLSCREMHECLALAHAQIFVSLSNG